MIAINGRATTPTKEPRNKGERWATATATGAAEHHTQPATLTAAAAYCTKEEAELHLVTVLVNNQGGGEEEE